MDSIIQVYIIMLLTGFYALIGAIPVALVMAAITYKTKDKAYFRKEIDKRL